MYDLSDILERTREYLVARHPKIVASLIEIVRDPLFGEEPGGNDWIFTIRVKMPGVSLGNLDKEFDRYRSDVLHGDERPKDGVGGDYITVRSGPPLLIGDGDDSGAVWLDGRTVCIWLRNLDD